MHMFCAGRAVQRAATGFYMLENAFFEVPRSGLDKRDKQWSEDVSCGVRTHAELPPVDLKSTPLATRAN